MNELKHLLHIPFGGVNRQEVLTEERKLFGIISSDPTLRNDWARTGCRERGSCFLIAGDIRAGAGLSLTRLRLERWGYRFSLRLLRHREPLLDKTRDYMRMIYFIYCIYTKTLWDEPLPHCIEVAVHLLFGLPAPGTMSPPPSPLIYLIVFFSSVGVETTNPLRATYTVSVQECYTLSDRQYIARHKKNNLYIQLKSKLYIHLSESAKL